MIYREFIDSKAPVASDFGFDVNPGTLNKSLRQDQRSVVQWALKKGRAALFLDTGTGKTLDQLCFADECTRRTNGKALVLAPVAVGEQTRREADRFGIDASVAREQADCRGHISIANYERIHRFDVGAFDCIVLDESSILKSMMGKTRVALTNAFRNTRYRLACTATPAPNDYMEIGNHSEWLGCMSSTDMLTRWFVHDSANTADWRLKKHATNQFWSWVSSWAVCASKPSDLGFDDVGFNLPKLNVNIVSIASGYTEDGSFLPGAVVSATGLGSVKRATIDERVSAAARIANEATGPVVVWCLRNDESSMLHSAIPDSVEVVGSDSLESKEEKLIAFSTGSARVIVTKPSIAGFGLNWQHCSTMVFASVSYSYEQYYQAIRRCWRFGQSKPVDVNVIVTDAEENVWSIVQEKQRQHEQMKDAMASANFVKRAELLETIRKKYEPREAVSLPPFVFSRG